MVDDAIRQQVAVDDLAQLRQVTVLLREAAVLPFVGVAARVVQDVADDGQSGHGPSLWRRTDLAMQARRQSALDIGNGPGVGRLQFEQIRHREMPGEVRPQLFQLKFAAMVAVYSARLDP